MTKKQRSDMENIKLQEVGGATKRHSMTWSSSNTAASGGQGQIEQHGLGAIKQCDVRYGRSSSLSRDREDQAA